MKNDVLPDNKEEEQKIKFTYARFTIIQGKIFWKSFFGPYLTYVKPSQVKYILAKLCEGEYGNLSGAQSLAHKIITTSYYWPTLQAYAKNYMQKCDRY